MNVDIIDFIFENINLVLIILSFLLFFLGFVLFINDSFFDCFVLTLAVFLFIIAIINKNIILTNNCDKKIQSGYEVYINVLSVDADKIDIYSYDNFKIDDNNKRIIISANKKE